MATINTKKNATLNRVQMLKDSNSNMEYLSIDGIPCGYMGSVSEADREAGIRCIQKIVDNSNKKGYDLIREVMAQVKFEADMNEKQIQPDEQVKVEDTDCVISYKNLRIYTMDGKELASAEDYANVENRAVKEILKLRAQAKLHELEDLEDEDDSEDDDEE
ncbi:MAG: hypothetical protein DBY43_06365 [Clostridiaceae bacterium]|nr:MAG: hypothetical protein DBY43_06365 [Clostridiaceae bacterium]